MSAFFKNRPTVDGASPSGKALVFGISIRRFDPSRPSQLLIPNLTIHLLAQRFHLRFLTTRII